MTLTTTEELKHLASSDNTNELTRRLARECLANREAQPVAIGEVRLGKQGDVGNYPSARVVCLHDQADWDNFSDGTKLYTAPPAPAPAVPGELLDAMEEVIRISDRDHEAWGKAKSAITACRAAMLAQHVSQGYKLQDCWVACSERMPEEGNVVLVCQEGGIIYCAEMQDGELYPDEFPRVPSEGREITHWMPLPAAPEASHDNS